MNVESILERVGTLPPLPGTSVQLMNVIADPTASVDQVVDVIKYDQALTGRVLKLCNSSYFGLSRQVASLNEAMICLGTVKLLQLVMAVHTGALLSEEQEGYDLGQGVLWKHSVAVAQGATHFAKKLKLPNPNLTFTAGLLHDIGKVVLSKYVAEEFSEIVRRVTEEEVSFCDAERAVLGYDHTQIGELIGEHWKLPEPIVRCIRYHHSPSDLEQVDSVVDTVYLSNCVCLLLGIGLGSDGLTYRADSTIMDRYQLSEPDLEAVGIQVLMDLQNVPDMTGTESPSSMQSSKT